MLQINIPGREFWDEKKQEFIYSKDYSICLEHSLVSISKWEAKWKKPFLSDKNEKTREEMVDYVKCMTITQNVDKEAYNNLTNRNLKEIKDYIDDSMTATWFTEDKSKKEKNREQITSELIYYWMIASQIPFECQKWHLNRLLTLIKICSIKNSPKKKMSKQDIMKRNTALHNARKKKHG